MDSLFRQVKQASRTLVGLSDEKRNDVLLSLADELTQAMVSLLEANREDLSRMDKDSPLYDRLLLTEGRLVGIASDIRHVAQLPSPLGRVLTERTMPNGLHIRRVSVPFGVIGVIYEARPNVTFDVFSLCMKSGNACLLKGGRDASTTNQEAIRIIHRALRQHGVDESVAELLPATREATTALLSAVGYVDLCIPRGGKGLIDFVRSNAKVPVIETGAGVVNTFFDKYGDVEMGRTIINNAKTRRVSVCNALDCLIVDKTRLSDLPSLCAPLAESHVRIYADEQAYVALSGGYPSALLHHATAESFGTEFMDYAMAVRTVANMDEALRHIETYGSGHSECIITQDAERATKFQTTVDAACVYWNAPVSFTDGAQFGLGAEIGISTQKLGARGPMGLEEMTSYKWTIQGEGQVRE